MKSSIESRPTTSKSTQKKIILQENKESVNAKITPSQPLRPNSRAKSRLPTASIKQRLYQPVLAKKEQENFLSVETPSKKEVPVVDVALQAYKQSVMH
jgi:hypothetical protein